MAALGGTLRDDRSSVRQAGAAALARAGGAAAVPSLAEALGHKDPGTRKCAALALGSIDAGDAVAALRQAMTDRDKIVREAAVEALAAMGSAAAISGLVAGLPGADRELKGVIAARLKATVWTPASPAERIVHAALNGRFDEAVAGGSAAVEPLVAALADGDPARVEARQPRSAAWATRARPRPSCALFKDTDASVRDAAVGAVAAMGLRLGGCGDRRPARQDGNRARRRGRGAVAASEKAAWPAR